VPVSEGRNSELGGCRDIKEVEARVERRIRARIRKRRKTRVKLAQVISRLRPVDKIEKVERKNREINGSFCENNKYTKFFSFSSCDKSCSANGRLRGNLLLLPNSLPLFSPLTPL